MACRQDGFVWTQMFTDYYEWFGVAAVLLMLMYNGQRGSGHKQCSIGSTQPMCICFTALPACFITC